MIPWRRALRLGSAGAGLVLLGIAVLVVRMVRDADRAMTASDRAFDQGDLREALVHARRAGLLYAPGLGHVARSRERLEAIATGAEATGHHRVAVAAREAIRAVETETGVWVGRSASSAGAGERWVEPHPQQEGTPGGPNGWQLGAESKSSSVDSRGGGWSSLFSVLALITVSLGFFVATHELGPSSRRPRLWRVSCAVLFAAGVALWVIALRQTRG